jgi:hypothetical protein
VSNSATPLLTQNYFIAQWAILETKKSWLLTKFVACRVNVELWRALQKTLFQRALIGSNAILWPPLPLSSKYKLALFY